MSPQRQSLISLVVIAAALGAAALAWRLAPPPPPPPGASLQPVFGVAASDVRAIDVVTWQGVLRAQRTPGGWQLDEVRLGAGAPTEESTLPTPSPAEVDRTLDTLVDELVATPEIDRFAPGDLPMTDFGLDRPQGTITLELVSGDRRTLEIGGLTISTAALYGRVLPGDDVLQVGSLIFNNVAAALFRLRALAPPGAAPPPGAASQDGA
jgi:hypothetical protein